MTTRALEDQEIKAIFENISGCNATRNRAMLIVGIGMALRASELVGLNVGDVYSLSRVKQYVTIRGETAKFGKQRDIRLWEIVKDELYSFIEWKVENNESIKDNASLFVSREGGHLTRQALFHVVKNIFSKAGINQSCHALRKTGGTIFYLASNGDLISTQMFLGHASPETTRTYIGIPSQKIKEYTLKSSDWFKNAIEKGEFNSSLNRLNSKRDDVSDSELIMELIKRGYAVSQAEKKPQVAKVIPFPKAG